MMHHHPPQEKQQGLFVNTKKTCFLCLQDNAQNCNGGKQNLKIEPFSLRKIFKLLQLDAENVLGSHQIVGPLLEKYNLLHNDLAVVLCQGCHAVATQVGSLFGRYELLKMKLDLALRSFAEILENSERNAGHMAQFRKKRSDPHEALQSSMAALIRQETLKKCSEHLKPSLPGPLVNVSNAKIRAVPTSDSHVTSDLLVSSGPDITMDPFTTSDPVNNFSPVAVFPPDCTSTPVVVSSAIVSHPSPFRSINLPPTPRFPRIPCKDCGKTFINTDILSRHRKSRCTKILSSNFKCQYCDAEFNVNSNLRAHIDTFHRNKRKGPPDGRASGRCGCGKYFQDLRHHIRSQSCTAHAKKVESSRYVSLGNAPAENASGSRVVVAATLNVSCEYCGCTFSSVSGLFRHQRDKCELAKAAVASAPPPIYFNKDAVQDKQSTYKPNIGEIDVPRPTPVQPNKPCSREGEQVTGLPANLAVGDYQQDVMETEVKEEPVNRLQLGSSIGNDKG